MIKTDEHCDILAHNSYFKTNDKRRDSAGIKQMNNREINSNQS